MDYVQRAKDYFTQGYNCAQAVAMGLAPAVGQDEDHMRAIANAFGGGFTRLREVCGAVSGMMMIIGLKHSEMSKTEMYEYARKAIDEFKEICGSYICRDLINATDNTSTTPEARTTQYYAKRPCLEIVEIATKITLKYIGNN